VLGYELRHYPVAATLVNQPFNKKCAKYYLCLTIMISLYFTFLLPSFIIIMQYHIISGSIPTEHSFAAQLEAIYKYGKTYVCYYFYFMLI